MAYYIQVGSYKNKKTFDAAMETLEDAGVKTTVFNSPNDFYAVCIDCPFQDSKQAANVMKYFNLMTGSKLPCIIMEYSEKDHL